MSQKATTPTVRKPRPPRGPGALGKDIRETIQQAFYKAGGRDYLVRVAHRRPDVFLALLGKIIPQETRLNVLASYQAQPIPVEQRDALPAPATAPAVLEGVWREIGNKALDMASADPATDADWL